MEINKTNGVSFGANKLLTSTQKLKNGVENTVEVFLLNKGEDDSFVRTCIETLEQNKGRLKLKEQKLKQMLQNFSKDDFYDYFIAIKDGEQIAGVTKALYFREDCRIKDFITLTQHKHTGYSLWKAMINKAKEDSCNYVERLTSHKCDFYDIEYKECSKGLLPSKKEGVKFYKHNKQNKTNLLDYLDIDFQDRVI